MSVKSVRLQKILELVENEHVETQDQIQKLLLEQNIYTTQATISRDIKELGLVKVSDGEGNYYYAFGRNSNANLERKFLAVFLQSVISVDFAGHIACLHCHTGMANAACAALDTMGFEGVIGTLAGDDTIFILANTESHAQGIADQIRTMLEDREA